jgi:hypothetical protein
VENSYGSLATDINITVPSQDFSPFATSSPTILSPPTASSSPRNPRNNIIRKSQHNFKLLNTNFQSIRNKSAQLSCLIDDLHPDIIIGTESHLSPEVNSSEIFPPDFHVYRNDRDCHGGTLIAIRKVYNAIRRTDLESDCEIIWTEVFTSNKQSTLIGSFYRPPSSPPSIMDSLEESLSKAFRAASNQLLILGGDFNLPGIDWNTNTVIPSSSNSACCHRLLDIMNNFHLTQTVLEPTRRTTTTNNILDLIFISKPDLIKDTTVSSGQSDHDIVTANIPLRLCYKKQPGRKVYDFKKGNHEAFIQDMKSFISRFFDSKPEDRSVEENWCLFKNTLLSTAEKHFPLLKINSHSNPWFTRVLRRLIRKKTAHLQSSEKIKYP